MSDVGPEGRSFESITREDLERLGALAAEQRADFFRRRPDWGVLYESRVLCTALCQGAALHYAEGAVGINDFDVYTFYAHDPRRAWYAKARTVRDFGHPKFGQSVDKPHFVGRRVDLLARGIPAEPDEGHFDALRRYLASASTRTARCLSKKAVLLLEPADLLGTLFWRRGQAVV